MAQQGPSILSVPSLPTESAMQAAATASPPAEDPGASAAAHGPAPTASSVAWQSGQKACIAIAAAAGPSTATVSAALDAVDKYAEGNPEVPIMVGSAIGSALVEGAQTGQITHAESIERATEQLIDALPRNPSSAVMRASNMAIANVANTALNRADHDVTTLQATLQGACQLAEAVPEDDAAAKQSIATQVGTAMAAGILGGRDVWAMSIHADQVQDAAQTLCRALPTGPVPGESEEANPVTAATAHSALAAIAAASDGTIASVGQVLESTRKLAVMTDAGPKSQLPRDVGAALGTVLVGGWGVASRKAGDAADVDTAASKIIEALPHDEALNPVVAAASHIALANVAMASDGSAASVSAAVDGASRLLHATSKTGEESCTETGALGPAQDVGRAIGTAVLQALEPATQRAAGFSQSHDVHASPAAVEGAAMTLAHGFERLGPSTSTVAQTIAQSAMAQVAAASDGTAASVRAALAGTELLARVTGIEDNAQAHDTLTEQVGSALGTALLTTHDLSEMASNSASSAHTGEELPLVSEHPQVDAMAAFSALIEGLSRNQDHASGTVTGTARSAARTLWSHPGADAWGPEAWQTPGSPWSFALPQDSPPRRGENARCRPFKAGELLAADLLLPSGRTDERKVQQFTATLLADMPKGCPFHDAAAAAGTAVGELLRAEEDGGAEALTGFRRELRSTLKNAMLQGRGATEAESGQVSRALGQLLQAVVGAEYNAALRECIAERGGAAHGDPASRDSGGGQDGEERDAARGPAAAGQPAGASNHGAAGAAAAGQGAPADGLHAAAAGQGEWGKAVAGASAAARELFANASALSCPPDFLLPPTGLGTVREAAAWLEHRRTAEAIGGAKGGGDGHVLRDAARQAHEVYHQVAEEFSQPLNLRSVFLEPGERQKLSFFVAGRWGLSKKRFFTTRCADAHVGGWRSKRMQILVFDSKDTKRLARQQRDGAQGDCADSGSDEPPLMPPSPPSSIASQQRPGHSALGRKATPLSPLCAPMPCHSRMPLQGRGVGMVPISTSSAWGGCPVSTAAQGHHNRYPGQNAGVSPQPQPGAYATGMGRGGYAQQGGGGGGMDSRPQRGPRKRRQGRRGGHE
eukprot:TRINITY_DN4619_c0_g1_i4.p1 TRINITY_DN4619_c0_g1~~TRINITY_DN4619_c0_g1_i4.p1  ORF type:complete len:1133 (+),score=269.97 TRINITY_DN4619_c0_g1_i4:86-3400(+)